MGLIRLICALCVGGGLFAALPIQRVLSSSQELIAFLALLMAGLLPAMILTATILRGALTTRATKDYGEALRKQLDFWAVLFGASALATFSIVGAKIGHPVTFYGDFHINVPRVFLVVAGASIGVILLRLPAAYFGLVSLLEFNVEMAMQEARRSEKAANDALVAELAKMGNPPEYTAFSGARE